MEKVIQSKIENSQRKIRDAKNLIAEQELVVKSESEKITLYEKQIKELEKASKKKK